jgi:hypothetical protein
MDMSAELVAFLVKERLQSARAEARSRALLPRREPLRVRLGAILIALGQRLVQEVPAPQRITP